MEVGEILEMVFALAGQHIWMTSVTLCVSAPLSLAMSYGILNLPRVGAGAMKILGILYTVPGLALMIFFLPVFGLNERSVIASLVVYAQFILTRSWVSSLRSVDSGVVESAIGMGMSRGRVFLSVQLPLAAPGIVAGLRIAVIAVIGLATLGAKFNAGGLGKLLFDGIAQSGGTGKIWLGVASLATLSLAANFILLALERRFSFFARVNQLEEIR